MNQSTETTVRPLFSAIGVELEYMIVDRETLQVKPFCDVLIEKMVGAIAGDFENGEIAWSNELVSHVVELKTNGPAASTRGLNELFYANIKQINALLAEWNAMLLPGGAHPWMNPFTETTLWPHENREIYNLYNQIFDCRGHGWSNLQSMHLNLPFHGDEEFGRLHAAIRLLMPLMPALTASTPLLDGKPTGYIDSRLETYRHNQKKIPSIAGSIVPEAVFTRDAYYTQIFQPIVADIQPYDREGILEYHFLNSRGAIARFDRGAIEIRILDLQEAPAADLALAEFFVVVLRNLTQGRWIDVDTQMRVPTNVLASIFLEVIRTGSQTEISHSQYLVLWGIAGEMSAAAFWAFIFGEVEPELSSSCKQLIQIILKEGNLSERILRALDGDYAPQKLMEVYSNLAICLDQNLLFAVASSR